MHFLENNLENASFFRFKKGWDKDKAHKPLKMRIYAPYFPSEAKKIKGQAEHFHIFPIKRCREGLKSAISTSLICPGILVLRRKMHFFKEIADYVPLRCPGAMGRAADSNGGAMGRAADSNGGAMGRAADSNGGAMGRRLVAIQWAVLRTGSGRITDALKKRRFPMISAYY